MSDYTRERFTQLDADITTAFAGLRHTITGDYRDLESQSFGLVVTAVSQADREPPADVRTAAIVIITTLSAWALMVGAVAAAALFGLIAATFATLGEPSSKRNEGRPPQ